MKKLLSVVSMLVAIQGVCAPAEPIQTTYKDEALKIQAYYQTLVNKGDKKVAPDARVIEHVLRSIDEQLPKYFPNGPFNREDFIAIAMLESDFHQFELGTSGERGIFQIMKQHVRSEKTWEKMYNIDVNTSYSMKIMLDKYNERKDFRKTIIAYNGYVVNRRGQLITKYWRTYLKHKEIVHEVLGK